MDALRHSTLVGCLASDVFTVGPSPQGVVKTGYGAYGIIREQDLFEKRSEFQAWAIDVKKVDIESM